MTSSAIESNSKKSRRWWQLSIRTLLILSAILAITAGVFFRRVRTSIKRDPNSRGVGFWGRSNTLINCFTPLAHHA